MIACFSSFTRICRLVALTTVVLVSRMVMPASWHSPMRSPLSGKNRGIRQLTCFIPHTPRLRRKFWPLFFVGLFKGHSQNDSLCGLCVKPVIWHLKLNLYEDSKADPDRFWRFPRGAGSRSHHYTYCF